MDLSRNPLVVDMRHSIDHFDVSFLHLLAERTRVAEKIVRVKQRLGIDLGQSEARKEDMRNLVEMSVRLKLDRQFFGKILDLVFHDAIERFGSEKRRVEEEVFEKICEELELGDLRDNLLNLDRSLCVVLAERFRIVKRMGRYKNKLQVPPLDMDRWRQVLDSKAVVAKSLGVSVSLVTDIFNSIHEVSLKIEREIMANTNG